jgi:P4 family phage/plasmid primase-like protien
MNLLKDFLNNHRTQEDNEPTHSCFGVFNGKFTINKEDNKQFKKLYINALTDPLFNLTILYCQKDISKLIVDIDIKLPNNSGIKDGIDLERFYDDKMIKYFIKLYKKAIKKYIYIKDDNSLNSILFEKPKPTIDNNYIKDGFHLLFPNLITNSITRKAINKYVIDNCDENNKKYVDDVSIKPWLLYGCSKPNGVKYEYKKIFDKDIKEIKIDFDFKELFNITDLYNINSNKCNIIKNIEPNNNIIETNIKSKNKTNEINEDGIIINYNLIIKDIIDGLNPDRFDNYNDWISLYMIFINEDLDLELLNEYCKKSSKYNEKVNNNIIKNIKPKSGLTIKTLFYWLKNDNIDCFNKINQKHSSIFIDKNKFNHFELAQLYYNMNPHQFIFDKKMGWYAYNNYNILIDYGEITPTSLFNDISLKLQMWVNDLKNSIDLRDKTNIEKFKICGSAHKMIGMSSTIKGIVDYLKNLYNVDDLVDKLDNNKNVIAFNNKLFDLTLGKFRDIRCDDFITMTCKYSINEKSNPEIRKVLNKLLYSAFENNEIVNYYLTTISLSLFGRHYESFYIHTGSGRNCKGVLSKILIDATGDYFLTADNTFLTTIYKAGQANSTLAQAKGVRILLVSEPDNGTAECNLNVEFVKSMTGSDNIRCRDLYKKSSEYTPFFSLIMQCNSKPKLNKIDIAIEERLKIIHYPFTFVDDPVDVSERKKDNNLKDKLSSPEIVNEFMLLLLENAVKNKNIDKIILPELVKEQNKAYIDENNTIKHFILENYDITTSEKDKIKALDLLNHYNNINNDKKIDGKKLKQMMEFNKFKFKKCNDGAYYTNLKIKNKINDDFIDNDLDN